MEFLISVTSGFVAEVGKYVIKPIGRQLGYLVFYNRNKKEFKEQHGNLETTKRDVQQRIEEARSNGCAIYEKVSKWLVDVDNEKSIHDELSNSNPSCFNLLPRHQLSRKMKKRSIYIIELIQKGNNNLDVVGYCVPLPDTKNTIVPRDYQVLESKTSLAKEIKNALAKPEVNKIGVYGMGGVGKTYLLNEVKKLVLEDRLFDRVIDVVVGQSNDVMQMQQQIGDILNKKLPKTENARASALRNMLEEMKGNILIMFDDLWKEYDLIKEVGIPCLESRKERCKVLVTSRFPDILTNYMNINNHFEVTCLDEEESWKFFTTIIGDKFDTTDMENIAKVVAKECSGLPLALDIIAKALKGKHIYCWEVALSSLKNPTTVRIKYVGEKVYASLKLSYDFLDEEEARLLFLLCSVFPDDYEILITDLQMYTMGMRLLKRESTWKKTRNKVHILVEVLTSYSLLQLKDKGVKMHDIVRDVAIYIGSITAKMCTLNYGCTSSEGLDVDEDNCGSYRAIFANDKNFCNLLPNLKFPKLELLILRFSTDDLEEHIEIVNEYFEGMENLKVLDLKKVHVPSLLWTSLKNLRTLCMSRCECNGIDTIGHLKELEILKISDCSGITELPATMSRLTQLKVLIVSKCSNLVVIRPNTISSMTKLEELEIQHWFKEWGEEVWYENTRIKNAQLSELNYLPNLSILRLEIPMANNTLLEDLTSQTLKKLKEFSICIGTRRDIAYNIIPSSPEACKYKKSLYINVESQIGYYSAFGTVIDILLEGTEHLMIVNDFENGIFKANGNCGYPLLKCLVIDGNSKMTHLIENGFTSLEWLGLKGMMMLESLVPKSSPTNSFNNLKVIKLISCKKLKNLFSFGTFKDLSNLQMIDVESCDMMDEIVSVEIEDQKTIYTSPLTSLYLRHLNQLTSFCTKLQQFQQNSQTVIPFFDQQVSFPELKNLSIVRGNNLEVLWYNSGVIGSSFSKLQSINIQNCNKLRCMFPSNIVASLVFLDTLHIYSCELLEEIFEIEKSTFGDTKVVPLRVLIIFNLPNLKYVWNKDIVGDVFALPNLKEVSVGKCPKLRTNFPASDQIERLEVDVQNEIFVVDEETKLGKVVLFESLRRLKMSCKQATDERFWIISKFPKLQSLTLVGCEDHDDKMVSLPMEMSEVLYHIENFEIRGCIPLVQVFGNAHIQRCANLKRLTLLSLPKLTRVFDCIDRMTAITFLNLVGIEVVGCNGMINVFSSSVAKNLMNLDSIKISNCTGMTSIVASEELEENGEIVFNKLTRLEFDTLPRLACFHSGKCTLKFPILNKLKIWRCDDMKTFSYGITNTPNLQSIKIGAAGEVPVSLIQGINDIIQAFFTEEIEFLHGMKNVVLSLKSVKRIRYWHEQFSELKSLTLIGNSEDDDIFCLPLEMSEVLYNIEDFEIRNALQLTQVFENEELLSGNNNNHVQRCAKLKNLYLCDLPKLTHVWKESSEEVTTISFDSLEYIGLNSCWSLKCVLPSSVTFLNLDSVAIYDCNGMMNLFSSFVAKNLGNLRRIEIADCTEMTSIVITAEEEENGEICFRKLDYIQLYNLPRLATFLSGKCMLKFPSLATLHIEECNEMETFSTGIISTPKLQSMSIGGRKFQRKDINVIIQDIFIQVGGKHGEL